MKKISLMMFVSLFLTLLAQAQQPVGWAGCASLEGGSYAMRGGAGGKDTLIYSHEGDMAPTIMDALLRFDHVVLDGSHGAFTFGQQMELNDLSHKTIEGRNGAVVQTRFVVTEEIRHMMDTAHVKQYSTSGKPGVTYTLSNGRKVREECEYQVRQHLIDYLNDPEEMFQMAGLFAMNGCEDIILRNLKLQGPGAIDVSGKDLLTLGHGSRHIWVDHCDFVDGIDGNFDINSYADFITVSWCTFSYTERSYIHKNTNLIGANDNARMNGEDCLNVTFQNCIWGKGCDQRMPMVRFGKIHLLNCLYDCAGCSRTVNPRLHSEVLMEGCVWKRGVKNIFSATDATAYQWRDCIFEEPFEPQDLGTVEVPYNYKAVPARKIEKLLRGKHGAGAKL